jgi:hypothetical protein
MPSYSTPVRASRSFSAQNTSSHGAMRIFGVAAPRLARGTKRHFRGSFYYKTGHRFLAEGSICSNALLGEHAIMLSLAGRHTLFRNCACNGTADAPQNAPVSCQPLERWPAYAGISSLTKTEWTHKQ